MNKRDAKRWACTELAAFCHSLLDDITEVRTDVRSVEDIGIRDTLPDAMPDTLRRAEEAILEVMEEMERRGRNFKYPER